MDNFRTKTSLSNLKLGPSSPPDEQDSVRRRTSEAPMKKLLAQEMEFKCRPPTVIGRLMGLDSLPPPIGYLDKRSTAGSKERMEYVRHKFMDVKRLSTDEKLQHSKESNRYAEQNSEQPPLSTHSRRRKNVYIPSKHPEVTCHVPTRIVLLKPNFKRVQNAEIMMSSPDSLREFGSSESLESFEQVRRRRRRDSSFEEELMRHRTQGSRDLAKEITRQMRHSVSSGSKKVPTSRHLRGYAGDDSSYSLSENESPNEFERKTSTSTHLSDRKSRYSPSSSVSKEARKRLFERWKMTHGFQELGKVSGGNTLGEMLAMPEKETGLATSDSKVLPDAFSNRLSRDCGVTRCASPLGISSRDGWKDECVRSLPRSRSLPASSTSINSPKARIRYGFGKDRCSMPKEFGDWHSSSSEKADTEMRNGFIYTSNTKSRGGQKSHPLRNRDFKPDELGEDFTGVDLCERRPVTLDIVFDDIAETTKSVDIQELSAHNTNLETTPICPMEVSVTFSHCTITEVESPASSKEAGQPSPVSVLEPPFADEFSLSSDSFEKISADLHGLRKQLQLLKLESSDAYSEGSEMIVSSDEDTREGSQGLPGEDRGLNGRIREDVNKEFSHMDSHPWVKQDSTVGLQWNGGHVAEELWKLMVRHDRVGTDCALMNEMKWLDLGDEVNAVGNEIVRLLFDDLVAEVAGALVTT